MWPLKEHGAKRRGGGGLGKGGERGGRPKFVEVEVFVIGFRFVRGGEGRGGGGGGGGGGIEKHGEGEFARYCLWF